MAHEFGEVAFTLTELVVATYNITTGAVGSAVPIEDGQTLDITPMGDTDELKAFGRIKHMLSIPTHAEFKGGYGGISRSALAVITGNAEVESGTTPSRTFFQNMVAGGVLPYFAIAGRALVEGGGSLAVGLKACMLDKLPAISFDGKANKFIVSEFSGRSLAAADDTLIYMMGLETAAALDLEDLFA